MLLAMVMAWPVLPGKGGLSMSSGLPVGFMTVEHGARGIKLHPHGKTMDYQPCYVPLYWYNVAAPTSDRYATRVFLIKTLA